MLKKVPSLTRPTPVRQDTPFRGQGHSVDRDLRPVTHHVLCVTPAKGEARTPLEGFCNILRLWYVSPWVSRLFYC